MSHTVTITSLPDEDTDDFGYRFGGTHGGDCEVFVTPDPLPQTVIQRLAYRATLQPLTKGDDR